MRAKEFLLEYNRQLTIQNFGDRVINQFKKEGERAWGMMLMNLDRANKEPEMYEYYKTSLIQDLEKTDPTPHKEYVQWLARMYCNGQTKLEDVLSRGADALARFQKLKIKKQLLPADRDINRLRSLSDLESLIERYPDTEQAAVDKGRAIDWYKDNDLRIVIPGDETAACYYGQGTRWCTAARENNMFDHYDSKGKLYIIFPTKPIQTGEKYQFHFTTSSFMDEKDNPADLESLFARYPQLKTIFNGEAKHHHALQFLISQKDVDAHYDELMNYVSDMMYNAGIFVKNDMLKEYADILKSNRMVYNKFNYMFSDQDDAYNDAMMDLSMAYLGRFTELSTSAMAEDSDVLQDFLLEETYSLHHIIDFIASKAGDHEDDVQMDAHFNMVAGFYTSIKQQIPKIIKTIWTNL